ncbi:uncharacterized protein LOC117606018 isoform X2 [Osmia lignaria lignaria]|uniref:uncharacterized protein LOC117606018 isoform X2 n=1 Tax=Osmia lignaria lignaria TaxID=1437193 RepID=UPI00147807ED|nr:uncharacterized protein LOC117606018 isoform X2 [Osmia lignaria]
MPYNLKNKNRVCIPDSSDSDSNITFYRKERLRHVKKIKRNLQTICDNDSPMMTGSDNDIALITQRDNINHIDIINADNNKHKKMGSQINIEASSSESDIIATKGLRRSRRKRTKVQAEYLYDFDSDSSASLMQNKRKLSRSSSAKQQAKKSGTIEVGSCSQIMESESNEKDSVIQNRENVSKPSSMKKQHNKSNTVEVTEDICNEKNYDDIDIIASSPMANTKEAKNEKEQDDHVDYKPYITKVLEDSKNRFTMFKSQITYLQEKFNKDEVVHLQDANNIIFMLTCIISKLKEELTDHQHNLMDAVIECRMQNSPNCIISSMHHERFLNNNHLQVQRKTHSPFNGDKLISTSVSRKRPLQIIKISRNILQPSDKNIVPHINRKQNNIELASKENNFLTSVQVDEDNVTVQNDKFHFSIYDEETVIDGNEKNLIGNISNMKSNLRLSEDKRKDRPIIKYDFFKNILNTQKLMQLDSDVDSTCSTLNLFFSEDVDEPENNDIDTIDARDKTGSHVSEVTLNTLNNNNTQKRSLSRINSIETTILPHRPAINTKKVFSRVKKEMFSTSMSNENLIQEISNANDLNTNYHSKYTDEKLQMNCRVLIEKCRL